MVEKSDIYQLAQSKADEITRQAYLDAQQSQHDADKYVVETLAGLERELRRVLTQVENGIKTLAPKEEE